MVKTFQVTFPKDADRKELKSIRHELQQWASDALPHEDEDKNGNELWYPGCQSWIPPEQATALAKAKPGELTRLDITIEPENEDQLSAAQSQLHKILDKKAVEKITVSEANPPDKNQVKGLSNVESDVPSLSWVLICIAFFGFMIATQTGFLNVWLRLALALPLVAAGMMLSLYRLDPKIDPDFLLADLIKSGRHKH